jgi:hypothetical protein
MSGVGPRWDVVERLFEIQCERLGLDAGDREDAVRPLLPEAKGRAVQGELFGS